MWGFATVLNDILVPHLKAVFSLNYAQSLLVQFVCYLAYPLMLTAQQRVADVQAWNCLISSLPEFSSRWRYWCGACSYRISERKRGARHLLPAACYVYVLFYALWGAKATAVLQDERLA
jgi:fucose permease